MKLIDDWSSPMSGTASVAKTAPNIGFHDFAWLHQSGFGTDRPHHLASRGAFRSSNEVMEVVEAALAALDPEESLADRLRSMQALQRARFEALPDRLKHYDWVLLRHEQLLRRNQAVHDAAVEVLHLLKSWSRAA